MDALVENAMARARTDGRRRQLAGFDPIELGSERGQRSGRQARGDFAFMGSQEVGGTRDRLRRVIGLQPTPQITLQIQAGLAADLDRRAFDDAVVLEQDHQHAIVRAVGVLLGQREWNRRAGVAAVAGLVPDPAGFQDDFPPGMAAGDRAAPLRNQRIAVLDEAIVEIIDPGPRCRDVRVGQVLLVGHQRAH